MDLPINIHWLIALSSCFVLTSCGGEKIENAKRINVKIEAQKVRGYFDSIIINHTKYDQIPLLEVKNLIKIDSKVSLRVVATPKIENEINLEKNQIYCVGETDGMIFVFQVWPSLEEVSKTMNLSNSTEIFP